MHIAINLPHIPTRYLYSKPEKLTMFCQKQILGCTREIYYSIDKLSQQDMIDEEFSRSYLVCSMHAVYDD